MIDTSLIPAPKGKTRIVKRGGNTQDIINSILYLDDFYDSRFCKFAKQFEGKKGLKRLWSFVKYEIEYRKDNFEESLQLTPPALWRKRSGDCKSKTLFINAVLKCLDIPYVTRFTNYEKGEKDVKHVYTVALIDGKELPIDSVYSVFGSEKKYNLKKDYMPKIMEISGFKRSSVTQKKCDRTIPISQEALIRMEEIRQKKQYVKEQEFISFSKISEGTASLKILERQMIILETMLPERKKEVQTGLNLIRKALKGDYSCTGSIPKTLAGTVATIKNAEKWSKVSATSFGGSQIIIDKLQQKRKECKIGAFPERVCLAYELWRVARLTETDPSYRLLKQFLPQHKAINDNYMGWGGICQADLTAYARAGLDLPASTFPGAPLYKANGDKWMWDDVMTYAYGRDSKYFKNYKEAGATVLAELVKLNSEGIVSGLSTKEYNWTDRHNQAWGLWSCQIANQTDYELAIQRLNESSGVLDAYINDIFRADATRTDGTLGSGFLYTFGDSTTVNPNDFPASVISKTGFQNQWLDATNYFSNISRSNVKGMARNGILYDNGGTQPEYTLEELVKIFKTGSQPSINEPVSAIISSIVMLIGVIVSAVVTIVDITKDAEKEAGLIDPSKTDMANFNPLGNGSLTSQNDWIPGGGSTGSEKNMMLLAGAGLLGAAAFMSKDKSKKKKKKKKK